MSELYEDEGGTFLNTVYICIMSLYSSHIIARLLVYFVGIAVETVIVSMQNTVYIGVF